MSSLRFSECLIGLRAFNFESLYFLLDLGQNTLELECKTLPMDSARGLHLGDLLFQFLDLDMLFVILGLLFLDGFAALFCRLLEPIDSVLLAFNLMPQPPDGG